MLKTHQKFRMLDENKGHDFFIEANWNPKDEKTNECKIIKFTFPNGEVAHIKREHLNSVLFVLGSAEDQMNLVPQKISRVKWHETVLSVKATKPIAKGENITFPVKMTCNFSQEDIVGKIPKVKSPLAR